MEAVEEEGEERYRVNVIDDDSRKDDRIIVIDNDDNNDDDEEEWNNEEEKEEAEEDKDTNLSIVDQLMLISVPVRLRLGRRIAMGDRDSILV